MGRSASTRRRTSPLRGWLPLVVLPACVLLFAPAGAPRWAVMWVSATAIFAGCKWLTWRRTPAPAAPAWRHAAYLFAWPGLDAAAFLKDSPERRPTRGEWAAAAGKSALGVSLLVVVCPLVPADAPLVRGWVGMAGVVFALHFGAFHLLSCAWRAAGVEARPLMDRPAAAAGLAEFWGRRWNTAFRDLTHRFLFRPLGRAVGPRWGLAAGFLFSGLVHDLVISVPAGGGYGRPTAYFALQGVGLLVERSRPGRRLGLGRGWAGWAFAAVALVGPVALLFHPPFVLGVVVPFVDAMSPL